MNQRYPILLFISGMLTGLVYGYTLAIWMVIK